MLSVPVPPLWKTPGLDGFGLRGSIIETYRLTAAFEREWEVNFVIEKQMLELLDTLSKVDFEGFDIDDFLAQRESNPFDGEWMRVYQAVEALKKDNAVDNTREIEKKAYITVYEKTEDDEVAGYIADDFGLIADSKRLGYSNEWLDKLIFCYKNARIPCGKL